MPLGFHKTIKHNYLKTKEQIYEIFEKGDDLAKNHLQGGSWKFDPKNYETTKEDVLNYIEKVKDVYKEIFAWERLIWIISIYHCTI